MIKVIFITNKLVIGGVEKALLSMIKRMPRDKYKITIGVINKGGELEREFPDYVDIVEIPQVNESIKALLVKDIISINLIDCIKRIYNLAICNISKDYNKQCIFKSKMYNSLPDVYDVAVAYHKPIDLPVTYVLNNIVSNNKILWLHGELKELKESEKKSLYKIYNQYNQIICVSIAVKNQLLRLFPDLRKNTSVIKNIIDEKQVIKLSEIGEQLIQRDDYIRILTVARLSAEKGINLLIQASKKLKQDNIRFKWFVVGDGPIKNQILNEIEENDLSKYIQLLGSKENPYGYFKSCDIYVQPSLEEGFGITVSEAKLFFKPIVLTNFATASEHIINGKTGYIVEFNGDDIAEKIENIINNPHIGKEIENNLKLEMDKKNSC